MWSLLVSATLNAESKAEAWSSFWGLELDCIRAYYGCRALMNPFPAPAEKVRGWWAATAKVGCSRES